MTNIEEKVPSFHFKFSWGQEIFERNEVQQKKV